MQAGTRQNKPPEGDGLAVLKAMVDEGCSRVRVSSTDVAMAEIASQVVHDCFPPLRG
jgi:hypothetical protein